MEKESVIAELRRVASHLGVESVSRSTFRQHGRISDGTAESVFGTWNEAVVAAGLRPFPQGGMPKDEMLREERVANPPTAGVDNGRITDEALLKDLLRLAKELGKRPSGNQIDAKGKYSSSVYKRRWGSVPKAYELATGLKQ